MEAVVNYEDILRQILLRVPAKSLLRFKYVSKHWLELISSPSFGNNHATCLDSYIVSGFYIFMGPNRRVRPVPLHGHQSIPPLSFIFDALNITADSYITDSCNGLMLCLHGDNKQVCVFNPTTQKYTLIPLAHDRLACTSIFMDFDPTRSVYHKIVFIPNRESNDPRSGGIYIYSSEDKLWRCVKIDRDTFGPLYLQAYWDGTVHYFDMGDTHFHYKVDHNGGALRFYPNRSTSRLMFVTPKY